MFSMWWEKFILIVGILGLIVSFAARGYLPIYSIILSLGSLALIGVVVFIGLKQKKRHEEIAKRVKKETDEKFALNFYSKSVQKGITEINDSNREAAIIIASNVYGNTFKEFEDIEGKFELGRKLRGESAEKKKEEEQKTYETNRLIARSKDADKVAEQKKLTEIKGKAKYTREMRNQMQEKRHLWYEAYSFSKDAPGETATVKLAERNERNAGGISGAVLGGMAAGLTGSHVVGAAVAYQQDVKNAAAKSAARKETVDAFIATVDLQGKAEESAKKYDAEAKALKRTIDDFEARMCDGLNETAKFNMLKFGTWECTVNENKNLIAKCKVSLNEDVKILDSVGLLDGSLKITAFLNGTDIAVGYYCFPGFDDMTLETAGIGSTKGKSRMISALCVTEDGTRIDDPMKIQIKVEPVHMWTIEV